MESLNPTLWRTCKMLAGSKRIQLLRQLHEHPGKSVTALGEAVGIKRSAASQELRRIQSRGLLKSKRHGVPLVYHMESDPQVPSAAPLLKAIRVALKSYPTSRDLEMCTLAANLANDRRISIVRALLVSPLASADLQLRLGISADSLAQHLRTLIQNGFVKRNGNLVCLEVPKHPLAQALIKLVQQTL